jgi:DNA-binding NarL/FixJ family response regulator
LATVKAQPTRVAILIEQRLFGEAIARALSESTEFDIVSMLDTFDARALRAKRPQVLLLDVDRPADIEEIICKTRVSLTNVSVLLLTTIERVEAIRRAASAGAQGFVTKEGSIPELVQAISSVAAGDAYVDPRVAGKLFALGRHTGSLPARMALLSPREREVLTLLAEGRLNREISDHLHVSLKTVKNHVSSIFTKLEMTSRTEAAVHAVRSGLL